MTKKYHILTSGRGIKIHPFDGTDEEAQVFCKAKTAALRERIWWVAATFSTELRRDRACAKMINGQMRFRIPPRLVKIINLTPHDVTIVLPGGETKVYPTKGVARLETASQAIKPIDGVPAFVTSCGRVVDLPSEWPRRYYIVSAMVRQALPSRLDLLSPSRLVRDPQGSVVGYVGFDTNGER